MSELSLKVTKRSSLGSRQARAALARSRIFANVYGHGISSIAVEGDFGEVSKIVKQAGLNKPLQLSVDQQRYDCLVGDIDIDPLTQKLRHVGFRVVKRDEKVTTEVPLRFIGEPPALRRGLIMVTVMDKLTVEATPANIPEFIEVDTAILEEDDQSIRVHDLSFSDVFSVLDEGENVIVKVEMPKEEVIEEVPAEEEAAGEMAEGEAAEEAPAESESSSDRESTQE